MDVPVCERTRTIIWRFPLPKLTRNMAMLGKEKVALAYAHSQSLRYMPAYSGIRYLTGYRSSLCSCAGNSIVLHQSMLHQYPQGNPQSPLGKVIFSIDREIDVLQIDKANSNEHPEDVWKEAGDWLVIKLISLRSLSRQSLLEAYVGYSELFRGRMLDHTG